MNDTRPYTAYVQRASGFVAGWFHDEDVQDGRAQRFVDECNRMVPTDPAELVEIDDHEWDELLAQA